VLTWNVMPGPLPPLRLGTLICHKPFTEFVLVFMYDPAHEDPTRFATGDLVGRVRAAVGDGRVDVRIKGVATWQVNAQVAPVYSAGRVFCMGDAVHRHPPTNGLGLNMSVADAYNLAWKLAFVLDGRAGTALLDSYSAERQPVGAEGVSRAITSLGEMAAVDAAIGFEPGQSEADGWAAIAALDEPGSDGARRRKALADAVAQTDYQFNAHGLELGYVYPNAATSDDPVDDDHLHYQPTTRPGARVPHARLELNDALMSTLDLVDGLGFTLLTGPGGERWTEAAAEVTARTGVPVTAHVIGRGTGGPADPYGDWEQRREVECDGCVLVRPDRHVAWRHPSLDAEGPARLRAVMDLILARAATDPLATPTESAAVAFPA
jgi:2,4-dichlorophenol 6-monooxygenase